MRLILLITLIASLVPRLSAADVLWRDPGRVEALDLAAGPGGASGQPRPPFTFVREDMSGSSVKIFVRDSRRRLWDAKFGPEVRGETFSSRMVWAAGYFGGTNYYVASGRIEKVGQLSKRAAPFVGPNGEFTSARFQFRDPGLKIVKAHDWSWDNNPFLGTPQLAGLKLLLILLSNWDNKDARDPEEGGNTAIFQHSRKPGELTYAFTDWGQTMGRWGTFFRRTEWNCAEYAADTPQFIRGVKDGFIDSGYTGRHTTDFKTGIRVEDARWLANYVGRLNDRQIRAALKASGATTDEEDCFTGELRRRIDRMREVTR